MSSKRPFVKAQDTVIAPEKSRAEIERMLRRYGAVGFSFMTNMETGEAKVEFVVPNSKAKNAPRIPVRIPVNHFDVFDAMYGVPTGRWNPEKKDYDPRARPYTHDPKRVAQAERVAWRNLALWIDAALSAATIGLRTIAETFAGDRLVADEHGGTTRVAELIERNGHDLTHGGRVLLLGPGT